MPRNLCCAPQKRLFCKIITPKPKDVHVFVKRYKCKKCGLVQISNEVFYPNCNYGKPIVDMCLYFASENPYNRVEEIMMKLGIQVDRDTVRNYAILFKQRCESIGGLRFLGQNVGVNLLSILFDAENVSELKTRFNLSGIESVIDETYPALKGAKKKLRERNVRAAKHEKPKIYPEGFTLATSYLPQLKIFSSLIYRSGKFNWGLAKSLSRPLVGTDYNLTDGSRCYEFIRNRERCLVHRCRNERKRNFEFQQMKKFGSSPMEITRWCRERYLKKKEEMKNLLKHKYPGLVKNGEFVGALTTNSIEGGNWRIKYALRTQYKVCDSIGARVILILVRESQKTFSRGKPFVSFGASSSKFKYENVMSLALRPDRVCERIHYDAVAQKCYKSLDRVA